jgi:hypothetical protein
MRRRKATRTSAVERAGHLLVLKTLVGHRKITLRTRKFIH